MNLACLQRRTDHAVKSRQLRVFRVVDDDVGQRRVDADLLFHALLAGGGQLRDGDEQRARAVSAGQALERGGHHGAGACRVEVHHIHVQRGQDGHGLFDGVGDVVQLEIEKDLVASGLDLADDGRALGVEQLHADLHERLFAGEAVEKRERFLLAVKVQGDDDVFTHDVRLL